MLLVSNLSPQQFGYLSANQQYGVNYFYWCVVSPKLLSSVASFGAFLG